MLTPDEIRAAKELAEKATPGKWRVAATEETYHTGMGCTPSGCPGHQTGRGTWVDGPKLDEYGDAYEGEEYEQAIKDAAFIAASRTLVPALCDTALAAIAERDAAMAVLSEARTALNAQLEWLGPCEHEIGKCECDLRNLLAAIDALLKDKSDV